MILGKITQVAAEAVNAAMCLFVYYMGFNLNYWQVYLSLGLYGVSSG